MKEKFQTVEIPVHPDDYDVPISLVHIALGDGRYAKLVGPLGRKTITALSKTLEANKDTMTSRKPDEPDDFSI